MNTASPRERIRNACEEVLASTGEPMHNSELAAEVLPELGLEEEYTAKDLNTALHDDYERRFERVGSGTWKLRE